VNCFHRGSSNAFIPRFAEIEGFFISGGPRDGPIQILLSPAGLSISNPPRSGRGTLKDQSMFKKNLFALAIAGALFAVPLHAGDFAGAVISYNSGAGYANGFTNPAVVLGAPTTGATPFAPAFQSSQLLSIGAGGFLIVQMQSPILNDPSHPYGLDFNIFGNSFFVESGGGTATGSIFSSTSPGSTEVLVSQDGVNFYELDPALAPTVNYAFPTDGSGNSALPVNPALVPSDFAGLTLAGIRSLYNGSAGGSSYSISWAHDAAGNDVPLSSIDYVEVEVLSGRAQIDSIAAVPEPTALQLLAPSIALMAWCARKNMPGKSNHR
jgi:hypothetical protein